MNHDISLASFQNLASAAEPKVFAGRQFIHSFIQTGNDTSTIIRKSLVCMKYISSYFLQHAFAELHTTVSKSQFMIHYNCLRITYAMLVRILITSLATATLTLGEDGTNFGPKLS